MHLENNGCGSAKYKIIVMPLMLQMELGLDANALRSASIAKSLAPTSAKSRANNK